jgi:hypothetical protein
LHEESVERRDLTLAFFFDGGSHVNNISYVAIASESVSFFNDFEVTGHEYIVSGYQLF